LTDLRRRVRGFREDPSTPDSRSSDHAQRFNPVITGPLVNLMNGGNDPGASGNTLHVRLRYFDPLRRRAGLPEDVAALVDKIEPDSVSVTLVNLSQTKEHDVTIQAGAYGEHTFTEVRIGEQRQAVNGTRFTVRLTHGAGARLQIGMRRYANTPALTMPWDK
jgi:hypothetical protein